MYTIIRDLDKSIKKEVARLKAGAEAAVNVQGPLHVIYQDMMRVEDALFASQGRRGGGSWKPLAESTIRDKGHDTILVETTDLLESLTREDAKYQIIHFGEASLEFGTERPGAGAHQKGRGVPRRPIFKFTKYDEDRWANIISNHLLKAHRA